MAMPAARASADENHCVNCAHDGLKQYRTLCLHPRQDEPGFWAPTPDNRCPFFEKAGNVMAMSAAGKCRQNKPTVTGWQASGGSEQSEVSLMEWKDQYKHPLWQQKRLEALNAAGFECQNCGSKDRQLHVHHVQYRKNAKIWEYGVSELRVLCDSCHEEAHQSKDRLFGLIAAYGAGSESLAAELLAGYFAFDENDFSAVGSHEAAVGYGAGYLANLDAEDIRLLTQVSPTKLKEFVRLSVSQYGGL